MSAPCLNVIRMRCKANPNTECWEWANCTQANGYGRLRVQGKTKYVHRYVYELVNGPIPPKRDICHKCDNRRCCNPEHLFLGTRLLNMRDATRKGRVSSGARHSAATTPPARRRSSTKLSLEDAREIRRLYLDGERATEIAKRFSVDPSNVRLIVSGKAWKDRTFFSV